MSASSGRHTTLKILLQITVILTLFCFAVRINYIALSECVVQSVRFWFICISLLFNTVEDYIHQEQYMEFRFQRINF
jgi:hypothetical protein